MRGHNRFISNLMVIVVVIGGGWLTQQLFAADSAHDAFTYQGQLKHNGEAVAGVVDLKFRLYDETDQQVGPELVAGGFDEFDENGRFTIDLAFGKGVFDGTALWLEIEVDGVTLAPRQPIMPTPYSVRALNVATVADGALSGTYTGQLNLNNAGNTFTGSFTGNGSGILSLNASNITSGIVGEEFLGGTYGNTVEFSSTSNLFLGTFSGTHTGSGAGLTSLNASNVASGNLNIARMPTGGNWSLSSTLNLASNTLAVNPANGHVGIGTNLPDAPLHVAEGTSGTGLILPGLRVFQNDTSPNVIGGSSGNEVGESIVGATIGGGGRLEFGSVNSVLNNYGTVSGGLNNSASGEYSTIGGGLSNTASGVDSTVGGGRNINAIGVGATVSGGLTITASGSRSAVGGGSSNSATGNHSTIGGGNANQATDSGATVGGGFHNRANGSNSTVAGGNSNIASGELSTISGGWNNTASGSRATVPGGNLNAAGGDYSFASGRRARVRNAAQADNSTGDQGTFIWADSTNADFTSTGNDQFLIRAGGGVGIGTNTPDNQLTVAGDADVAGRFAINTTVGGDQFRLLSETGEPAMRVIVGATTRFRVYGTGGVGIGSNMNADQPPGGSLAVSGSVAINVPDNNASPFRLAVNGTAANSTGSWSIFSDARLKHNIQPLPLGTLDRLLAINGYTFEYHDDAIENRLALPGVQTGLIAHEVAEVFPDWVDEDEDGYLFITERGTTALFVEALRELREEKDAENAAQQHEIETLRAENQHMRNELNELRSLVEILLHGTGNIR